MASKKLTDLPSRILLDGTEQVYAVHNNTDYRISASLLQGLAGNPGQSAYELAVAGGFVGTVTEWLASLVGAQGTPGLQGIPGPQGDPGTDGEDGTAGPETIVVPLGGGFLLDPNEFNGWGATGMVDDVVTHDLGNVGAGLSRAAGGLMFPFDVRLKRFKAKHYNNNNLAEAWGWRITKHSYTGGSNTISWENILDEVGVNLGVGPRNYLSTVTQATDIVLDALIPAGEVVTLGVEAPTAITTNRYAYIMSGYLEFEKV